jgi:uncharacterized damage-inducible protein DinB
MRQYFAFNSWAWRQVFESVQTLDDVAYHAVRLNLFHDTIHAQLVHGMAIERVWYWHCLGELETRMMVPADFSDFTAVAVQWRTIRHAWANFLQPLTDEQIGRPLPGPQQLGARFRIRVIDAVLHIVNHGTEHRSQLTPILADLGAPTKPLDYIRFRIQL